MIHVLTNCSFFYFPKDKLALKIGSIPSKKITHFSKTHWGCVCVWGGGGNGTQFTSPAPSSFLFTDDSL